MKKYLFIIWAFTLNVSAENRFNFDYSEIESLEVDYENISFAKELSEVYICLELLLEIKYLDKFTQTRVYKAYSSKISSLKTLNKNELQQAIKLNRYIYSILDSQNILNKDFGYLLIRDTSSMYKQLQRFM